MIRQIYLFSLISMAVLVCGQQDLLDSTVIVADPAASNLAPGQPPQGYSKDEIEEILKLFYQQNKPQLKENSGPDADVDVLPAPAPVYQSQQQQQKVIQPQELPQQQQLLPSGGVKQSSSGILEAAGMVGAGVLGGMLGSYLTEDQQPLYQGGYPYQQGPYYQGAYPAGAAAGYNPYPAGYPYQPPVYPSYAAGSGYYPGYVSSGHHHHHNQNIRNPLNNAQQQQPSFIDPVDPQPLGLKKKQQGPKRPIYPAGTAAPPSYYHFIPDQQQYLPRDYFYNQGPAFGGQHHQSQSDLEFPAIMSAIGSLATEGDRDGSQYVPRRPFNLVVNRRFLSQIAGGRGINTNKKSPLIGYLAKPNSQLPMTRDGQVDPQIVEQFAMNDGPFVYLYPQDRK